MRVQVKGRGGAGVVRVGGWVARHERFDACPALLLTPRTRLQSTRRPLRGGGRSDRSLARLGCDRAPQWEVTLIIRFESEAPKLEGRSAMAHSTAMSA